MAMIMELDGRSEFINKDLLKKFLQSTNHLSHTQASAVAEIFQYKELSKNEFLLKEGQIADEYFFLYEGFLRAFANNVKGNDITTQFYGPRQPVFEVTSFFRRCRSIENIQAITPCLGWYITYAQLNELFHTIPQFREFGRSVLVSGFSDLKSRMLHMITETAEQRYNALLMSNPEIVKYASLKHIASYLGITDTSLSRIRKDQLKK
ncbi:MAG: Crp/Fnr family transcriptional regulator [Saprospiraceae bacterium]|nr:Crp/Fnr family transcriptional regulator [Saprospiraceae bacterium]